MKRLLVPQGHSHEPAAVARVPVLTPTRAVELRSMDFAWGSVVELRPLFVWVVVDDESRECPYLLVAWPMPASPWSRHSCLSG